MAFPAFNRISRRQGRGALVVVGGILIHLSLGTLYTFGNLNPYLTSYIRASGVRADLKYHECAWMFAMACMGQGLTMSLGGLLEARIGPRLTCLLGGWTMSLGVLLTFFTIKVSFPLTVITYGLVFGFGIGIAYAVPMSCAMKWFPNSKGLVNGLVLAGFGGGAFIFNQIQTAFINPGNLAPNLEVDHEDYFDQASILDKVPDVFLVLAACYATMQFLGSLVICNPPERQEEELEGTMEIDQEETIHKYSKHEASTSLLSSRPSVNTSHDEYNYTPREMLKSKYFYMLWAILLLNGQGIFFISSLYKAYGQSFIRDDAFLATVGSFSAVFNALGRVWWGYLADKVSFRVSMMCACASFTCLMLTFQVTALQGKATFLIYVCLLFGSFCGNFALLPTATAKCFGRKYLSVNFGLVFSAQVVTNPVGVFLSQWLMSEIGWTGLFFLISCFSFISMIITIAFNAKDRYGQEI